MLLIFVIIVFLVLSAFFSGSEIAFISANKLGIAVKKEQRTRRGIIISRFYDDREGFLSAMLVGNNIALVAFTYFATQAMTPFVAPQLGDGFSALLVYTLTITVVVLLFGEFLPKTFFGMYSTSALFIFAYPLVFFKKLLFVPTYLMTRFSNILLTRLFGVAAQDAEDALTRVDLEHFIADSLSDDQDEIDKEILTNALNLGHNTVGQCMVPRPEIVSIDKTATLPELIDVFKESKLSRILVIDGDIDEVMGYIHHQQLLSNPKSINKLILDILYVPEVMNLKDLMLQFIKEGTSIACVVDEFGGTAGVITLEDILEEIFGEIEDEHDQEDYILEKINDDEYLLSGRLELDHINETFPEINLPEGEYQTLSGYVVMTSESIPKPGDELQLGKYRFIVEKVDDTKIEILRVIKKKNDEELLD